ncbi:unnamed protein product [Phytophthora lilii]|uniref:Unnamed protein product n=1 Tax=Phytophthora lilii TaxID=2077276 RepID=A0A9W6TFJ5_9STRA|nr:unnamed protein product [Phytophthora lilii]
MPTSKGTSSLVKTAAQQDWDEIAEKLVFAINNSRDATRKETPFYLVHGWDANARTTLRTMSSSLKRGLGRQTDALAWRREMNRQQEIALKMAKEHQVGEKACRAKKHNKTLSRHEKSAVPRPNDVETCEAGAESDERAEDARPEPHRSLFKEGNRVWLYMERVKPGLVKKLAHLWHGPFRVKKRVEAFAYELELPDRSAYKFYPEARLDFDEELLPEDSWEPDRLAGEYEVECILDDRTPLSTGTGRAVREFKVKWVGYDEPT